MTKRYDKGRTPAQRIIDSKGVAPGTRSKLVKTRDALDLVGLFEKIGILQDSLWDLAVLDTRQLIVQEKPKAVETAKQMYSAEPTRLVRQVKAIV